MSFLPAMDGNGGDYENATVIRQCGGTRFGACWDERKLVPPFNAK
jgi:hypothetical protein